MQPTALDITRQGDLGGQKVAMVFDENSIAHIMSVLTDLYSDPELAVIREYSTNALDAHIEAGQTRPIEVSTPNGLSPYFKVKDYGVGLSVYDIENIYSKYGASTKRGTNEQVGMLGLGCKSALTYTSQFNLIAVKDGVKATVAVARIEDGTGMMEIVDLSDTAEPNSVEVVVPVKGGNTFESKSKNFFRFWTPGSVLLNGREPENVGGEEVANGVFLVDRLDGDYVVMGNVAYEVDHAHSLFNGNRPYNNRFGVVAYVGIGTVNFTPSRESLHYTTMTNNTIAGIQKAFKDGIQSTITTAVATARSEHEAVEMVIAWADRFPTLTNGIKYKGADIPQTWEMPDGERYTAWKPSRHRHSVDYHQRRYSYLSGRKSLNITNFPSENLSSGQKAKIRAYMESKTLNNEYIYIFAGEVPGSPWTDEVEKVDWSVIKQIRLTPSQGYAGRKASGYRFSVVDDKGLYNETDELDTEIDIVYFSPADYDADNVSSYMRHHTEDVQVVRLTKNRWDKFERDFPEAKPLESWVKTRRDAAKALLTDDDKIVLSVDDYEARRLRYLDKKRIDDPELVRYINLVDGNYKSATLDNWNKINHMARVVGCGQSIGGNSKSPLANYPLIEGSIYNNRVHSHVYIYINAVYADTLAKNSAKAIDDESAA